MRSIIGITGVIASGKTFIAQMLKSKGALLFNADDEVKNLMETDNNLLLKVKNKFPLAFKNNELDRKILANIVFNDYQKLDDLENIIHPQIKNKINEFIKNNKESNVILDVPLLFESGLDAVCDKVITVVCDEETQMKRINKRKIPLEMLDKINKRQFSSAKKAEKADFIIQNNYNQDNLSQQVDNVWEKINA